jgi:hypothetical protein
MPIPDRERLTLMRQDSAAPWHTPPAGHRDEVPAQRTAEDEPLPRADDDRPAGYHENETATDEASRDERVAHEEPTGFHDNRTVTDEPAREETAEAEEPAMADEPAADEPAGYHDNRTVTDEPARDGSTVTDDRAVVEEPAGSHHDETLKHDEDLPVTHDDEPTVVDEPVARDDEPAVTADEAPVVAAADEPSTVEERADEPTELKPGDVPVTPVAGLWTTDSAQGFRDRWRDAQLRFVDDPRGVAEDLKALVGEAVDAFTSAISHQHSDLNNWSTADGGDTEQYRVVVQRYREFFERLLSI